MKYTKKQIQVMNAAWIDEGLNRPGYSAACLSDFADVSPAPVAKWRKSGQMTLSNILLSQQYLGTMPDYLKVGGGGAEEPEEQINLSHEELVKLPAEFFEAIARMKRVKPRVLRWGFSGRSIYGLTKPFDEHRSMPPWTGYIDT